MKRIFCASAILATLVWGALVPQQSPEACELPQLKVEPGYYAADSAPDGSTRMLWHASQTLTESSECCSTD